MEMTTTREEVHPPNGQDKNGGAQPLGIDLLWSNALSKYQGKNNISLKELEQAGDFKNLENGVSKATVIFESWRHPQDQKDKIIVAVGGCLDFIDKAANFLKDHVDGTYATPVKIIAGSVSIMIKVRQPHQTPTSFFMLNYSTGRKEHD